MAVRDTTDFPRDSVGLPTGQRGLLLYDADCGFCTWLVSVVLQWDRGLWGAKIRCALVENVDLQA
jgi:hypothetical protein